MPKYSAANTARLDDIEEIMKKKHDKETKTN